MLVFCIVFIRRDIITEQVIKRNELSFNFHRVLSFIYTTVPLLLNHELEIKSAVLEKGCPGELCLLFVHLSSIKWELPRTPFLNSHLVAECKNLKSR